MRYAAQNGIDPAFYERAVNVGVTLQRCIEAERMVLTRPRSIPKRRVSIDTVRSVRPIQFHFQPRRRLTIVEERPSLETFLADQTHDLNDLAEQTPHSADRAGELAEDVDTCLAEMCKNIIVSHIVFSHSFLLIKLVSHLCISDRSDEQLTGNTSEFMMTQPNVSNNERNPLSEWTKDNFTKYQLSTIQI